MDNLNPTPNAGIDNSTLSNLPIGINALTPEMMNNPGSAVDVLSQPNSGVNALTTSAAINATTALDAVSEHAATVSSPGFFSKMGINIFKALNFLNKPLQEVQKDYKFVHAVYSNYGVGQGLLATLGIVAGGVAGTLIDEPILGAGAAGAIERHIMGGVWSKAYAISEDPNAGISFGRDISHGISDIAETLGAKGIAKELQNTDGGLGKYISLSGDIAFDFGTDPLMKFGSLVGKIKTGDLVKVADDVAIVKNIAKGITEASANKFGVIMNTPLNRIAPQLSTSLANMLAPASSRFITPQILDAVKNGNGGVFGILTQNSKQYTTSLEDMANIVNKAKATETATTKEVAIGQINYQYNNLGLPFAKRLADMAELKKITPDDIHELMRNTVYTGEKDSLVGPAVLPSRTVLRMKTLTPLQNYLNGTATEKELNWIQKGYKTFTGYMPTSVNKLGELSTQTLGSKNTDRGTTIYRIANMFGNHNYALEQVGKYAEAEATGHPAHIMNMYHDLTMDVIKMSGAPDSSDFVLNLKDELKKVLNSAPDTHKFTNEMGVEGGQYHTTDNQVEISHPTGSHEGEINFPIPNFLKAREAMMSAGRYKQYIGKLDSFVSGSYTDPIFKPLALLTAGFGLRVAASELLPAVSRYGTLKLLSTRIQITLAKSAEKRGFNTLEPLLPGEEEHLMAAALHTLGTTSEKGKLIDPLKEGWSSVRDFLKNSTNEAAKLVLKVIPYGEIFDNTIESLHNFGGHLAAAPAVTTGMDATGYGMSEALGPIMQKEARKIPIGDQSFIDKLKNKYGQQKKDAIAPDRVMSLTEKDNYLRNQLIHNVNLEMKKTASKKIAQNMLDNSKRITSFSLNKDVLGTVENKTANELRYNQRSLLDGIDPYNGKPRERQTYTTGDLNKRANIKEKGLKTVNEYYNTNFTSTDKAKTFIDEIQKNTENPKAIAAYKRKVGFDNGRIKEEVKNIKQTKSGKSLVYQNEMLNSGNPRWINQDVRDFATDRYSVIKGMAIGRDGTLHKEILNHIANGKEISLDDISHLPDSALPASTGGHNIDPTLHATPEKNGDKGFQKIVNGAVNFGFKKVLDPIINWASREPIFQIHYSIEKRSLAYEVNAGLLSPETAARIASERAIHAMLPEIHNTALRSQFSQITRNLMPFYFAQEQAMKRAWKAAKDTSTGLPIIGPVFSREVRLSQMVEQTMNNPAFVTSDGNGNSYVNLPVIGEMGQYMQGAMHALHLPVSANLPMMVQGNVTSLKSVVPGIDLPGLGPILTVPLNALSGLMPSISTPINTALGLSANRGVFESLMPSRAFIDVWDALGPDQQTSALANATLSALMTMHYHNQLPGATASPQELQAAISKAKDNARSILLIKGIIGLLSPLSPKVAQGDSKNGIGFRDEWNNMLKPKSQGGLGLQYGEALVQFIKEHPPLTKGGNTDISYTISNSTPSIRGANFTYSNDAINWINDKKSNAGGSLLFNDKTSTGAAFLIPQAPVSGDSYKINQTLIMDHLRQQRTPEELVNQFYISQGNYDVAQPLLDHNKNMADLTQNSDRAGLSAERARWSTYIQNMANAQPIWYANYNSGIGTNNAKKALSQIETIFSDPKLDPNTKQSNSVKGIMEQYYNHLNIVNSYKTSGYSTGIYVAQEKERWTLELATIIKNHPELTNVINTVFSKVG